MKHLNDTKESVLVSSANNLKCIKWCVDAAFAVHPDCKSHTGAMMTVGKGGVTNMSCKQKLKTRSSTTAALAAADNSVVMTLWTKSFLEVQGHIVNKNVLLQDNESAVSLEENGERSSSQRARNLNMFHFSLPTKSKERLSLLIVAPQMT